MNQVKSKIPISIIFLCIFLTLAAIYFEHEKKANVLNNSNYNELFNLRYESFSSGKGKEFEQGKLSLNDLYKLALNSGELKLKSGKQEMFENIINQFI